MKYSNYLKYTISEFINKLAIITNNTLERNLIRKL